MTMPRFYFDVREGATFIPDEDGLEFDSFDVAEYQAAHAAAEIGRDRLPKGDTRDVTIELKNEHRQRVLTVTVSMQIDRVDPSPLPPRE
jgi:uncharacterized protein DUF6894